MPPPYICNLLLLYAAKGVAGRNSCIGRAALIGECVRRNGEILSLKTCLQQLKLLDRTDERLFDSRIMSGDARLLRMSDEGSLWGGIEYFVSVVWMGEVDGLAVGICARWNLKEAGAIKSVLRRRTKAFIQSQHSRLRAGISTRGTHSHEDTGIDAQLIYIGSAKSNYC